MSKLTPKRTQNTIRFTVVSIFILATLVTAIIAISLQYHFSKSMATESATQLFSLSSEKTQEHLQANDQRARNVTSVFAKFSHLFEGNKINPSVAPIFAEVLKASNDFYAMYMGYENGDFYHLINLNASPQVRQQIEALPTDRWVIIEVSGPANQRERISTYLNEDFTIRTTHIEPSNYNASLRPWFTNATEDSVYKTEPYMFKHLQAPGQTYSMKVPGTTSVLAIDIALSSIDQYLLKQGAAESTEKEVYLFQKSGEIISSNQTRVTKGFNKKIKKLTLSEKQMQFIKNTPTLKVSNETDWAPIDFSISGQPKGYSIDVLSLITQMTGLKLEYHNGFTWAKLVKDFEDKKIDILHPLIKTKENMKKGIFTQKFLDLPFTIITPMNADDITNITQLKGKELAIPSGWSHMHTIKNNFPSIKIIEYPSSKVMLEAISNGEVSAGFDSEIILRYMQRQFFIKNIKYNTHVNFSPINLETSLHFVLQESQTELRDIINLALDSISPEQITSLNNKWFTKSTEKAQQGVVPYAELLTLANDESLYGQLIPTVLNGVDSFIYLTPINPKKTEFLATIVPQETILAPSNAKVKLSIIITTICLLLVLPVSWSFSSPIVKPIKLLSLENEKIKNRQYEEVSLVKSNIKEINDLASSLVEMSISIKTHEVKQQELMDSFIQIIAQTIDDKSAYTGEHCHRVPELGLMLVDEVVKDNDTFKEFSFKSDDEYREFKISAWLHDCGKIITPEHIVDKGSKLETIYNRIHEIRMRFEVLWRDAELDYYKALIKNPEQQASLHHTLITKQKQLTKDFTFVAHANVGGEFMAKEKIEQLHDIAQQTWQRHFDDRLGLSPVEELHLTKLGESLHSPKTLPVTEQLLANKTEHIIKRDQPVVFDEKLAIKMTVPEHKANLGELYNLSISRGTLTAEDRYVINEHIIGTIKILDHLPFPPELANVPRFASTHHETLIGTGYPRKLTADDLSIPERVLVISDIFEALTASDRPYKKAKSLSVAVNILHKFALDQHIDIDLFELFLTSGVYLTYAKKHMKAEKIDDVDITKYIRV